MLPQYFKAIEAFFWEQQKPAQNIKMVQGDHHILTSVCMYNTVLTKVNPTP